MLFKVIPYKSAQTNGQGAVKFTFTFLHHSAERQRDVAKEKGLLFKLDRFQKQLKPCLLQRHF